jgi:acetylglutamate kinase
MAESIYLSQMIDGRRITDAAMLDVVMIYAGQINKKCCCPTIQPMPSDFCADGNLIQPKRNHPTINYGFVGDAK